MASPGHVRQLMCSEQVSNYQHWYCVIADWDVLDGDAHWRHLANTIEPSMCGSDAA